MRHDADGRVRTHGRRTAAHRCRGEPRDPPADVRVLSRVPSGRPARPRHDADPAGGGRPGPERPHHACPAAGADPLHSRGRREGAQETRTRAPATASRGARRGRPLAGLDRGQRRGGRAVATAVHHPPRHGLSHQRLAGGGGCAQRLPGRVHHHRARTLARRARAAPEHGRGLRGPPALPRGYHGSDHLSIQGLDAHRSHVHRQRARDLPARSVRVSRRSPGSGVSADARHGHACLGVLGRHVASLGPRHPLDHARRGPRRTGDGNRHGVETRGRAGGDPLRAGRAPVLLHRARRHLAPVLPHRPRRAVARSGALVPAALHGVPVDGSGQARVGTTVRAAGGTGRRVDLRRPRTWARGDAACRLVPDPPRPGGAAHPVRTSAGSPRLCPPHPDAPAGVPPERRGDARGGRCPSPTSILTYTRGLSYLVIAEHPHASPAGSAAPGPGAQEVRLANGSIAYYVAPTQQHGRTLSIRSSSETTLYLETNLTREGLLAIAGSLSIMGRVVPPSGSSG